jgi:hypothetical protein
MLDKVQRFYLLVSSDMLVWVAIIFPISIIIFYWCRCLPATKPFFAVLQKWIVYGVLGLTVWMAVMHFIQAVEHFTVAREALKIDKDWPPEHATSDSTPVDSTKLIQSKYFIEDLLLIKSLFTDEELAVYLCLANRPVMRKVDPSGESVKWQVQVQRSDLLREGFNEVRLNRLLGSPSMKYVVTRETSDDPESACYTFARFDGLYEIDPKRQHNSLP